MTGRKRTIALIICIISFLPISAQYKISGKVKDAHTEELIPFATLQFVGTNTGMVTDAEGSFPLRTARYTLRFAVGKSDGIPTHRALCR